MKESTAVQRSVAFMAGAVGVWWVANTIATIASKSVMEGGDDHKDLTGFTYAFTDWRWVELTLFQHLVGAILAGIWVKATGKSIWPAHMRDHTMLMYIAALGNIVGNMSTNAAYALVTSSTAQVMKACEPLFTFVLTLLLYRNYTALDISTLLSVVIIVVGAGSFLMKDATFNVWGMVAAMISNTAFPTRNIFLKKLSDIWDNPLQKFTVMSIYSTLFALPLWLVKVVVVSGFSTGKLSESLISSFFHSTYNLASITVLESVNPVTHAILNISKRLFVIMANILYFQVPFSFHMFLSLLLLLLGCYLYQLKSGSTTKTVVMKLIFLASFVVYLAIPTSPSLQLSTSRENFPDPSVEIVDGCIRHNQISIAWVYDRPIPDSVVSNIEHLAEQNPGRLIHVYCGTTHCVNRMRRFRRDFTLSELVVLPTILEDLPLKGWLAQHAFNKIIAGEEFEDHVQNAVAIGLLWKYGGFYINPRFRVTGKLAYPECLNHTNAWVNAVRDETELFSGAYFSKQHPLIRELANLFVSEYLDKHTPFKFDFRNKAWSLMMKSCPNCSHQDVGAEFDSNVLQSSFSTVSHFGTLSYERRVKGIRVANLGDEVQGFPGLGFLPFRDKFLDRDALARYKAKENVTAFFNAWWGDGSGNWPPPKTVHPIMVSIHLSAGMADNWGRRPDYLRKREPIGCRDSGTLNFMAKHGVKAYFSGCITLLMTNPFANVNRNDKIYFVDLKEAYVKMLPPEIQKRGIVLKHNMENASRSNIYSRFTESYSMMKKYGEAKLVITQRIHCALPCVAMNTPVIFFNSAAMPGGGGSDKKGSPRTAGLIPLFHSVDFYKMSKAEAASWIARFPWDNPPPNPNPSMMMRLRASSWNVIRQHQPLYDAGRKFGVIPMSPPNMEQQKHFVFHLVFTSTKTLNWQQWRSVEAIFYHHPTSEVIVHTNDLPQGMFDVLTEAGYLIKVANYDLEGRLTGSPAEGFLRNWEKARRSDNWFNRKAELLRLLILYQQGGVYLDTDVILVRPIDTLTKYSLVWDENTNSTLSTAFMMFEKNHPYVKLCLHEFGKVYSGGDLASGVAELLTRAWHQFNKNSNNVRVLPYDSFYSMVRSSSLAQQCFEDTAGQDFDAAIKTVKTKAYGVKLNSEFMMTGTKKKKGTVCNYLLTHYCVLCSNVY